MEPPLLPRNSLIGLAQPKPASRWRENFPSMQRAPPQGGPMGQMMPQGVIHPAQSMGFSGPPHALPPPQTIVATQRGASENDASQAGVGLFFQQTDGNRSRVFVKTIVKGGSADREGTVRVGDVIKHVQGKPLESSDLGLMRSLILGEVGTYVTLGFERDEETTFQVSLMRGNTEYFGLLDQKRQMQAEIEKLMRNLSGAEEEMTRLQQGLSAQEGQSDKDREALERLKGMLKGAEEQLRSVQSALNAEMMERRSLEAKLTGVKSQTEQDSIDVERLQSLLSQADDKLTAAKQSLDLTRKQREEQEMRLKQEQAKRHGAEDRERQVALQTEERSQHDSQYRAEQQKQLSSLEEERQKHEELLRREQQAAEAERRNREHGQERARQAEEQRQRVVSDNEKIAEMLREAEAARQMIEQGRSEAQQRHTQLEDEISGLEEQKRQRQQYIDDLKSKLELERTRWEALLKSEEEGKAEDTARYRAREEQLMSEMERLNAEMKGFKEHAEQRRRTLEASVSTLEQEARATESSLASEESLGLALKERVAMLNDELGKVEQELAQARSDCSNCQKKVQSAESDKLKALERERAMNGELARFREEEQAQIEALERLERSIAADHAAKLRELAVERERVEQIKAAKAEVDAALRKAQDEGQRMVDAERKRLEREIRYRKLHEEHVKKHEGSVKEQEKLRTLIAGLSLPTAQVDEYIENNHIFDDTAPGLGRIDVRSASSRAAPTTYHRQVAYGTTPERLAAATSYIASAPSYAAMSPTSPRSQNHYSQQQQPRQQQQPQQQKLDFSTRAPPSSPPIKVSYQSSSRNSVDPGESIA